MTVTQPAAAPPDAAAILEAAALAAERPKAHRLTEALLTVERSAKGQQRSIDPALLLGTWQLRFTAPKKPTYRAGEVVGRGFYLPRLAVATLTFSQADATDTPLTLENQLRLGPVQLRFSGPARVLPHRHLLAFDFLRVQVLVGRLSLIDLPLSGKSATRENFATVPVAKLPFFSFFAVQERYLAARGRSGGLALWAKV
jgi:hypothetical protein